MTPVFDFAAAAAPTRNDPSWSAEVKYETFGASYGNDRT